MFYCVTCVAVETTLGGDTIIHQVPTFFLNADVQGITSVEGAEKIAKQVVNPTNNPDIKVNCCVSGVLKLMS